ncbi:nucleotidyltransferase domain-containing protein [Ectobacillus ponti]|uniref:Nucleotidyltransferase domain-containing protein n=1 Tax=Ectobacillus ponti TaxID=2961894 RepID=A0AA42BQK4_9BACI|nr:nucleotidyltransferase domain-containing protein [Ectobacillus ponti]MCP8969491.1 nucleotidyltransferase domain-containing protein [Ectobacillus ponti]
MREQIAAELRRIEEEDGVKVLYAVESGSRAWGFAAPDSDYDVRFLYVHPVEWYLSIDSRRDVIERPVSEQLDISGWDLQKALRLLLKSNPALIEWLRSPIVYEETYSTAEQLRQISSSYISTKASIYHYLHMAKRNFHEYLQGDTVKVKKYLYVLRPILACMWLEREESIPPVPLAELLSALELSEEVRQAADELLAQKQAGETLRSGAQRPVLQRFLAERIAYYEGYTKDLPDAAEVDVRLLNQLFVQALQEIWKPAAL